MKVRKALTIAGSDSGGGAGIQADLKTFSALGVYGSSVITAITAQNTRGVQESAGISADLVAKQMDAVLSDIGAEAIKTGMLYDASIIRVITEGLKNNRAPLVVDPVMISTSGDVLLKSSAIQDLKSKLIPGADFITPNVDEASTLCGFPIQTEQDYYKAAHQLHAQGAKFIIITGIIREGECTDFCYDGHDFRMLKGPYINTSNTHGTGCSFSAALTSYLARGASSWTAVYMAKKYINSCLRYAYQVGEGNGPLNHMAAFYPGCLDDPELAQIKANLFRDWGYKPELAPFPLLNLIIGGPLCQGKDYAQLTQRAVQVGVRLIQLREKEGETRKLVETAIKMKKVCQAGGAVFIVNDRVDIAAASGADGVHLGQNDLEPQAARSLLGPGKIIGVSVENLEQADTAVAAGADYLGFGPVYPTTSKDCHITACESGLLAQVAKRVKIPVIAIGGITPQNTRPLLQAGASGIAVISAILSNPYPEHIIEQFRQVFHNQNV